MALAIGNLLDTGGGGGETPNSIRFFYTYLIH